MSGLPTKPYRIEMVRGDITRETTDAIVNAANSTLRGGGGVDGAIHGAGGPSILAECRLLREARGALAPGESVITSAGLLACRYVIHTVGPVWRGGTQGEPELLARCYRSCFSLVREYGLRTIAFPAISTGVYGYPKEEAARIAVREARRALAENENLASILFVCFNSATRLTYQKALADG